MCPDQELNRPPFGLQGNAESTATLAGENIDFFLIDSLIKIFALFEQKKM